MDTDSAIDTFFHQIERAVQQAKHQQPTTYQGADVRGRFDILTPQPRSWLLDLRKEARDAVIEIAADVPIIPPPDFTLIGETGDVLVEAMKGKSEFTMAMAKRQLQIKGNIAKLVKLKVVFEAAGSPQRHTHTHGGADGEQEFPMLIPVSKDQWEPDGPHCSQCGAGFSFTTRRHHCRFCGSLCCADCTRFRLSLKQKRACMLCHLAVQRARRDYEENGSQAGGSEDGGNGGGGGGGRRAPPLSPNGYGADYGQDVTQRMLTLESRLGHLERSRRVKKARTLLKCADWVTMSVTASFLMGGAFVGHYFALFVQMRGWDVEMMEIIKPGLGLLLSFVSSSPSSSSSSSSSLPPPSWWQFPKRLITSLEALQSAHPTSIDSYWLLFSLSLLLALLFCSSTLYRRSTTAFSVAAVLVVAIELTKIRVRTRLATDAESIWDEMNYIWGAYLRLAFFRLKGSYIKMAQYISSRADIVPDSFSDELSALQDAVPPSSLADVRPIIEKAMDNVKLEEAFYRFDSEALASASIAQVHRAVLKDGTDVVVKVQHPDVARLLNIDLRNIVVIFGVIAWLEPDYDFTMVAKEWSKEVRKELNFELEGDNLQRAYQGIVIDSGLDAVVPKLLKATPNVLVMSYCEGMKVTDPRAFHPDPAVGLEEKAAFMKALCEVFAYSSYVQGFLNGDPHPGNIFVEVREEEITATGQKQRHVRPVVLDWGLAKNLPERVRVGNAKIVLSVWEMDVGGMLDGMEECGMPIDKIDILEDLGNIRFLMRNTSPGEEAREQSKQFMESFVEKSKNKPKSERNPLKTMVPEVLFLARVTEMLQGLGAKLGVRVEYLHIMAAGCKRALLERPRPPLPSSLSSSSLLSINGGGSMHQPDPFPPLSFLDRKVRTLLQDLIAEGHGVGSQVVLYKNGRMLVNAAMGLRSKLDPGRVTPSTLFCGFSLTKAVLAILAHALIDDKVLSYETKLVDVWGEMKGRGKDELTLGEILGHGAGMQYAFPSKATPQKMWRTEVGEDAVKESVPVGGGKGKKRKVSMHYYSFGWLLVPMLEKASGKSLKELVQEKLLDPLGLPAKEEEAGIVLGGVPGTAELPSSDDARIAMVEYDLRQMVNEAMGGGGGGGGEEDVGGGFPGSENIGAGFLDLVSGMMDFGGDVEEEEACKEMMREKLAGREFLLDHRMLNGKRGRVTGAMPSLSGRFSARGLADVLESLCRLERSRGDFAQQQFLTTTTTTTMTPSPATSSSASSSSASLHETFFASANNNNNNNNSSNGQNAKTETTTTTTHTYENGGGAAGGVNGNSSTPRSLGHTKSASSFGVSPASFPVSVLSLARLKEMKSNPVDEEPGLTRLIGREHTIKLASGGVQLFGFEQPPVTTTATVPSSSSSSSLSQTGAGGAALGGGGGGGVTSITRRTVRWGSAFGHASTCGQLALCDPSSGLVLVVTSNKAAIPGQKNLGYEVLKLVAAELNLGVPVPIW